jgi:glycosyltransferase involved in cell wall biosynthesis
MPTLTFALPTYNRAAILHDSLERLIDLAGRHDVAICISDNGSTDDTSEVVSAAIARCPAIEYRRNDSNVGPDLNFAHVLAMPGTDHVWLLSDDDYVNEEALRDVLALIDTQPYDVILLNGGSPDRANGRVRDEPSRDIVDPTEFLSRFGWHATWISGLVMSRRLLAKMHLEAYDNTSFAHFIALYEGLANIDAPRIRWNAPSAFYPSPRAAFSSESRALEIFVARWTRAVRLLPDAYPASAKLACIRAHGERSGLLTCVGLLNLRAKGALDLARAWRYRDDLLLCTSCSWATIMAICLTPRAILVSARNQALRVRRARAV